MAHVLVSKVLCMIGALIGVTSDFSDSAPSHSTATASVRFEREAGEELTSEWRPDGHAGGSDGTRSGECLSGGCTTFVNNYPIGTFSTTSTSFVTVATDIFPGEYAFYSVEQGCIYEWTLCAGDGGSAPYDSQLSLRSQSGATGYCYSNNFCQDDAKIRWTASFTGTVRVLVTETNCLTDFPWLTTLRWRRESCPPPPLSNLVSAVSRKPNSGGPDGVCDIPIDLAPGAPISSEMRLGDFTEVVFTYDGPPPAFGLMAEADCTCPEPPSYASTSVGVECVPGTADMVCTFAPSVAAPGLTNACTYRFTIPSGAGTAQVELRALVGDANGDGRVNATDRSQIVAAWTDPAHFSCETDLDSSGRTNATDRSLAVSAWTGVGTNCAP